MVDDSRGYTQSLVNWGESGSFSPNAIPDSMSIAKLRVVQLQLAKSHPEATLVKDLHMTLFHCRPRFIRDYLKTSINPDLNQVLLYRDLANNFGTIALTFNEISLPIEEIERVTDDDSVVVIKLGRTAAFSSWLDQMKDLLKTTLRYHGASEDDIIAMREVPELRCYLNELRPNIPIAYELGHAALSNISLPYFVNFNKLSACSVQSEFEDSRGIYTATEEDHY